MYWDATYRVTTPLFLGGANPETDAELRPSTLKGLLRFWFRAIALSRLHEYSEVKNLENDIFGSTEKQSSFLLTIDQQEELSKINSGDNWKLRLAMGYGVVTVRRNTPPTLNRATLQCRQKRLKSRTFLPLFRRWVFGAAGCVSNGFGSCHLNRHNDEI